MMSCWCGGMQTYPEFCRQLLYESANPDFIEATAEWERVYGKVSHNSAMFVVKAIST